MADARTEDPHVNSKSPISALRATRIYMPAARLARRPRVNAFKNGHENSRASVLTMLSETRPSGLVTVMARLWTFRIRTAGAPLRRHGVHQPNLDVVFGSRHAWKRDMVYDAPPEA
ncbi:hypothetical protein AAE478_002624 [Parahypoxylon ruwenzoriense]